MAVESQNAPDLGDGRVRLQGDGELRGALRSELVAVQVQPGDLVLLHRRHQRVDVRGPEQLAVEVDDLAVARATALYLDDGVAVPAPAVAAAAGGGEGEKVVANVKKEEAMAAVRVEEEEGGAHASMMRSSRAWRLQRREFSNSGGRRGESRGLRPASKRPRLRPGYVGAP